MRKLVTAVVTESQDRESFIRSCLGNGVEEVIAYGGLEDLGRALEDEKNSISCVVYDVTYIVEDVEERLSAFKHDGKAKYLPFIGISEEPLSRPLQNFFHVLDRTHLSSHLHHTIEAAQHDFKRYQSLLTEVKDRSSAIGLIQSGHFYLKTLKEAEALTMLLSTACPDPSLVALGLSELLVNAIEHGNLEISYQEKSHLLETGEWEEEINRRLLDEKYSDRLVEVWFKRDGGDIEVKVRDQGDGFDWRKFVDAEQEVSTAKHGRGIALAIAMGFTQLTYNEKGNEVTATICS